MTGDTEVVTLKDALSKYYTNDNLRIRRAVELSDTDVQLQTEIYSDDVIKIT